MLQYAEGRPDKQAADQVRVRMDWKFLLVLQLDDPGFDFSGPGRLPLPPDRARHGGAGSGGGAGPAFGRRAVACRRATAH
ncbi:hypothetical protein [Streptomyces sp. NPDC002521]